MLLRLAFVTLLLPLGFLGATSPDAPPWPVPADTFALGDARMNTWSARPAASVVLTGRLLNLSADQRRQLALSASLVTLRASGQVLLTAALASDDTFRFEIPAIFPVQQLWLRLKPLGYVEVVLHRGLHLEIDAALLAPASASTTPGYTYSGPDGALNSEINRFTFAFHRPRQLQIDRALGELARGRDGDFAARLPRIRALRDESLALLRDFAPSTAGWFLRHEIDAVFYATVLTAAATTRHPLTRDPLWPEIAHHASYAVTNEQTGYFRALKSYLLVVHGSAPPDATAAPSAHPVTTTALLEKTAAAGAPLLPAATLEIALLYFLPRTADAAQPVLAALLRRSSPPWVLAYLAADRLATDRRVDAINAALADTTAATPTPLRLGPPLATLATGAALYHWPDLSGPDLLARLTQAFPGRALLLDFWGPWCTPCLTDLPHSEKLHAALKDTPVEFVYLACRTNTTPWRRAIADLRLSGTHVLLEDPQVDALMSFFGAGGFPAYVFIDRAGRHRPNAITRFAHTTPEDFRRLLD